MTASGHCSCGAVAFTVDNPSTAMHCCHCHTCRRWSGAPVFAARGGAVTFTGREQVTTCHSSEWAESGLCRHCGSHLFYRLKASGEHLMPIGAFDDQSVFTLPGESFIDEKPPGYGLAGDHPRLTVAEFFASLQGE